MSATPVTMPETGSPWELPSRGRVGMFCLIAAEAAIFIIFVVAYLFYIGKSLTGPYAERRSAGPRLLYDLPAFEQPDDSLRGQSASRKGKIRRLPQLVVRTIALGATFLYGTAREWYRLIFEEGLTIQYQPVRNNLLFAGRPARLPRDCGSDLALCRFGISRCWDT